MYGLYYLITTDQNFTEKTYLKMILQENYDTKTLLLIKETTIQGHYHTHSETKMIAIQTDQTRNQAKNIEIVKRLKGKFHHCDLYKKHSEFKT